MIVELDHRLFLAQDYAIINPMQVGKDQYADLEVLQLTPKGLERHERMMPLLVHLKRLDESIRLDLLDRSGHWARQHDMPLFSALLSSDQPHGRVKASLQARMVLRRSDGNRFWLRFHDPRVFRHLHLLLDAAQLAALMGWANAWLGYDPLAGCWHRWSCPDVTGRRQLRLQLDPAQWQAVEQFELLNRGLRDLADEGKPADDEAARRLLLGLLAARDLGLTQDDDVMLYARQQFDHGARIALLPAIK